MKLDRLCAVKPGTEESDAILDAEWPAMEITDETIALTQRFALRSYIPPSIGGFYTDEDVRLIRERASKITLSRPDPNGICSTTFWDKVKNYFGIQ